MLSPPLCTSALCENPPRTPALTTVVLTNFFKTLSAKQVSREHVLASIAAKGIARLNISSYKNLGILVSSDLLPHFLSKPLFNYKIINRVPADSRTTAFNYLRE